MKRSLLNRITVSDIESVVTVDSVQGTHSRTRNRKCYALSFCEKGKITYYLDNQKYVSDSGSVILLPKGRSYTLYRNESGAFPLINFDCTEEIPGKTFHVFPIQSPKPYMELFRQMEKMILFEENHAKCMMLFYEMLDLLSKENDSSSGVLEPAMAYIEKNYTDSALTNQILAELCNISEVGFRQKFLKHYGTPPHQYIISLRLKKAKQLLLSAPQKSVTEIALQCGFSSVYHFCRMFKKYTNQTPTEYSKMQNRL